MPERDAPAALVRATLEGPAPAALLDEGLRIVCVNEPWKRFAESGGARADHPSWAVGASYLDAISSPLRAWYERALRGLLGSREAWHHDYDCSTPELERSFRLTAYPQTEPERGLLLVHTCRVERPHPPRGRAGRGVPGRRWPRARVHALPAHPAPRSQRLGLGSLRGRGPSREPRSLPAVQRSLLRRAVSSEQRAYPMTPRDLSFT